MSGDNQDHAPIEDHAPVEDHAAGDAHVPHPGLQQDSALGYHAKRSLAIQELLAEKGIIGTDDIEGIVDAASVRSPADGARVVARAWVDPEFRARLLMDAKSAIAELGYDFPERTGLVVLENTERLHHLVVCTLCSCYPGALLGPPPDWYKSLPYRSRAAAQPRAVMREFGLDLADSVVVRVVDSTPDLRYLVLPRRPAGTEDTEEDELAQLVTRDSMIGVADPRSPDPVAAPPGG